MKRDLFFESTIHKLQKGVYMAGLVHDVSDAQFQEKVLQSGKITLVDFWAEWCGPCKAIAPIVNDIAVAYEGKINVMKMNIDDNPETPTQFHIKGIPTLILFKDGQMIDQIVGAVPKDRLEGMLKKHV
jgi:thioredoxin 1